MMYRLIVGAIVLIILLGSAHFIYWRYVASRLQTGIADWMAQQRGLGNQITFEYDAISGFPFAFRTEFRGVSLGFPQGSPPGDSGMVMVQGAAVQAQIRPWNLYVISASSTQPVNLALQSGGALQRAELRQPQAEIRLQANGALQSVALMAESVTVDGAETFTAEKTAVTVELPAVLPADYHQPLFTFDADVAALRLPPTRRALTDGPIDRVAAAGSVMGPVPPFTTLQDGLAGWANAGGTVELKSFAFAQVPLQVAGEGTVALDEALQPLGALTVRAQGLPETIDILARDGILDAQAAKTGGMMAKGLAKPDASGKPTVSASLSLQQGYLWLGPIKVTRLPVVSW